MCEGGRGRIRALSKGAIAQRGGEYAEPLSGQLGGWHGWRAVELVLVETPAKLQSFMRCWYGDL